VSHAFSLSPLYYFTILHCTSLYFNVLYYTSPHHLRHYTSFRYSYYYPTCLFLFFFSYSSIRNFSITFSFKRPRRLEREKKTSFRVIQCVREISIRPDRRIAASTSPLWLNTRGFDMRPRVHRTRITRTERVLSSI